ncbi:MFS transporter [Bartonella tribocorum]|uniref:MFS transporter n=1 Tax=Bartonella tribocorum TaxID=85701 RepID=A0A2M6UTD0_9HYPH|nr:MFS transporter [Bartonella tribocorum]PIT69478.1 MFS transporter [Bartonella tribocorum]
MFLDEFKKRIELFKNKNFLYFTLSGFCATFGNGLSYIVLSWFAYNRTNSIQGIALMMFCIWMPSILFAPLFGYLADRYDRKVQIILSNLVRGFAIITWVLLWQIDIKIDLMVLCTLLGIFVSFYMPCAIPFISSIIPKEDLIKANATIDMVYEFGTIIGMGISGLILYFAGMENTLLIGGVFFIIAGLFNFALTPVFTPDNEEGSRPAQNWWQSYISALGYFRRTPELYMPYLTQMLIMVLLMTIPIILVPYTREVLHADTQTFAFYEMLYSLGVVVGAFFAPLVSQKINIRNTLALLLALMALCLLVLFINTYIIIGFPIYFLIGVGLSSWGLAISLAQLNCDIEYQGRLQASFNGISGLFILGLYLLMAYGEGNLPVQSIYLAQSVLAFIAILVILFYRKGNKPTM